VKRDYWLLWLSQTVSRFGDGFFFIAVGWLVFADTRSPWALGLLWFLRRGLTAIAGTVLTPMVDRVDRRRLMVALDVARALATATPMALFATGALHTWDLYAVLLVTAILTTPYTPAAYAVLTRVAPGRLLARANAVLSGGLEVMYMAGPAAGGFFIARYGAPDAMGVDALMYAVSALLVVALPTAIGRVTRAGGPPESYRQSLALGWRLVREHATLRVLTLLNAVQGTTDMVFAVLMVPFVRLVLHGGSGAVGLLESSLSVGIVAASLAASRRGWAPGAVVVGWSVGLFCLATAALAWAPDLAWAVFLQVVAGLGLGTFQIRSQVLFQSLVAQERLGRALGVENAVLATTQSLGALVAGLAPVVAGVAGAFGVFGLGGAVVTGLVLRRRGWLDGATPSAAGVGEDAEGALDPA